MNKKILIASLFAILMLMIPMTSVIGVSDVNDNYGCNVISSRNLVRFERLLARFEVYHNTILLKYRNIPEVQEKCQELLDIINSNRKLDNSIICAILESIFYKVKDLGLYVLNLSEDYEDNLIMKWIFISLAYQLIITAIKIGFTAQELGCEWAIPKLKIFHL